MYQPTFSPHAMVHVAGSYQANGQFLSVQNHAYYAGSPTNMHQDFIQFNRHASNHNRQRLTQQPPFPLEFLQRLNVDQNTNYGNHNGGNSTNWGQRMNSPNNTSITPQRMHTPNGLSITSVQSRMNYRPISAGPMKRNNWNNNNKLGKRQSFQDMPMRKESSGSNSDSGVGSRSPTPNKHYKGSNNQTESSDERDSLSSVSEPQFKNKNCGFINNRGNLVSSLSTGNLYQNHQRNEFVELTAQNSVQNYQNRRRYSARGSPQRHNRGKKHSGNIHPHLRNRCPPNPVERFLERADQIQAKSPPLNELLPGSIYDKLSNAIWEKFEQNQLTQSTFCHKMYLWRFLFFFIKSKFPHYELFTVGSTLNGFGSNNSDIDMCLLVLNNPVMDPRSEAIFRLGQIQSALRKTEYIDKSSDLIQAKVPILRIHDNVYNLDVDLNYNNVVGVRNTHLLYCYSQIDWRVRPLVLIVKMWAQFQNINNARHMTISSYSYVLMVIHFLQCGVIPAVLPCLHKVRSDKFYPYSDVTRIDIHEKLTIPNNVLEPRNTQTLGELLIEFFKYYDSFDYDTYAISVRAGNKIPIKDCRNVQAIKNDPHQWKYLCIEEPFEFTNTARSVYDPAVFQMIKDIFKQTYQQLKKSCNLNSIFTRLGDVRDDA